MVSSYPPAVRRQLLAKHFLISTMPEPALDHLVRFSTVARLRLLVRAEYYRRPAEQDISVRLSQHDFGSMIDAGREADQ
jgi:hypothetical protein